MLRPRSVVSCAAVLLAACLFPWSPATAQSVPGSILKWQKISSLQGDMTHPPGSGQWLGLDATSLGDLDGNGVPDVAVGGNKRVWIFFMETNGKLANDVVITAADLSSPASGFAFGAAVESLGDLDGDGVTDIAVGDPGHGGTGAVYILFLNADGSVKADVETATGANRSPSESPGGGGHKFGDAIANMGDLDGDGITDIAVGEPWADVTATQDGQVWLFYLNANGTVKGQRVINENTTGGLLDLETSDRFGRGLDFVGDVNGDGFGDLAVGAPRLYNSPERGAVFVLFLNGDQQVTAVQEIAMGVGGFTGVPATRFGHGLATLGDIDGNGVPDIVAGSAGGVRVFVVLLKADGTVDSHHEISVTAGTFPGASIQGDFLGSNMGLIGDLDGDGRRELAVGAPGTDEFGSSEGTVWITWLDWSEWTDLGGALPGSAGTPHLAPFGTLVKFQPVTFTITNLAPATVTLVVSGLSAINTPFKGGVLVPTPDVVVGPFGTGSGTLELVDSWPPQVPRGLTSYYQLWTVDPAAPKGFSATNAVAAIAP